jgi:serine/threonine protein phosphatase PrpC
MEEAPPLFKVSACVAEHIGDRADQQDRVAILTSPRHPGALLAIVADGMGGRTGGRIASDQVVATARAIFEEAPDPGATPAGMLERIANEAHAVVKLSAISSEKEPHSTLVALYVQRQSAHWVHAGDSRLYHYRNGRLASRTADHTYGTHLASSGRLDENHAAVRKLKNVLYSAIGIGNELRVEHGIVEDLQAGDAFLLGSDGLWAYFKDEELGAALYRLGAKECAQKLIEVARQRARGVGDNLSVAIVKLDKAGA